MNPYASAMPGWLSLDRTQPGTIGSVLFGGKFPEGTPDNMQPVYGAAPSPKLFGNLGHNAAANTLLGTAGVIGLGLVGDQTRKFRQMEAEKAKRAEAETLAAIASPGEMPMRTPAPMVDFPGPDMFDTSTAIKNAVDLMRGDMTAPIRPGDTSPAAFASIMDNMAGTPEAYAPTPARNPLQPRPLIADPTMRAAMEIRQATENARQLPPQPIVPSDEMRARFGNSAASGPGFTPQASDAMVNDLLANRAGRMAQLGMSPTGQPNVLRVGNVPDVDAMLMAQAEKDAVRNAAERAAGNERLAAINSLSPEQAAAMLAEQTDQGPWQKLALKTVANRDPNAAPTSYLESAKFAAKPTASQPPQNDLLSSANMAARGRTQLRRARQDLRKGTPAQLVFDNYNRQMSNPFVEMIANGGGNGQPMPDVNAALLAHAMGGPGLAKVVSDANTAAGDRKLKDRGLDIAEADQKAKAAQATADQELRNQIAANDKAIRDEENAIKREGITSAEKMAHEQRAHQLKLHGDDLKNKLAVANVNADAVKEEAKSRAQGLVDSKQPDKLEEVNKAYAQREQEKGDWDRYGRVGPLLQQELETEVPKINVYGWWPDRMSFQDNYNRYLADEMAKRWGITSDRAAEWIRQNGGRLRLGQTW